MGPYRRPIPRVLGGSKGGGRFLISEAPLYRGLVRNGWQALPRLAPQVRGRAKMNTSKRFDNFYLKVWP